MSPVFFLPRLPMNKPRTMEEDYTHIQNRIAFFLEELEGIAILYGSCERSEGISYGVDVLKALQLEMTIDLVRPDTDRDFEGGK